MNYLMELGSIIVLYVSIINLNSFKFKLKEIVMMILLAECCACILLNVSEFIAVIPILIIPIILIYKSSKNIVRSISIPVVSLIIFVLSDSIITNIFLSAFGIDSNLIRKDIKLYWLSFILDFIFVYLITKFLGLKVYKKFSISTFEFKGKFGMLIVTSLLLTITIFYTNIIFESKNDSGVKIIRINGILFFAYFVMLMIIMYILIGSIAKEMEIKSQQTQFESMQEYTTNLEKLYTDMRAFRHDYINILSSMIGYIQNKDINGLERYFNDKIYPISEGMESNNFKIGLLKNIKNTEIKGIFSSKLIRAQELGYEVFIDIVEPIEKFNMDIIDLSRVVGILLDNAIEAIEKCDKPSLKVAVINKKNSVLVVIINNCLEEIPMHKIFQKGFSTKGENRGVGLYNLKQLTGKYSNVSIDTLLENGEFKQLLEIANN